VVLNEKERNRFKVLSEKLHTTYYDVVENTYPADKKTNARKGAKTILNNLIQEVQQASKSL
jgi:hypothetical protein